MNNLNIGPSQYIAGPPVYALAVKSFKCATDLLGTWRTETYKVAFPKDSKDYPFRKEVAQLLFITNDGNQLWGAIYTRPADGTKWRKNLFTGYVTPEGRIELVESGSRGILNLGVVCDNTPYGYTLNYRDVGSGVSFTTRMERLSGIANPPTTSAH